MAVVAESCGLIVLADNFRSAASAVIYIRMLRKFFLSRLFGFVGNAVFCFLADLLDFLLRKRAKAVIAAESLLIGLELQFAAAVRAFILNSLQK